MDHKDPELERLRKSEQDAYARYLRLSTSAMDPIFVETAETLWREALAAVEAREARNEGGSGGKK